MSKVIRKETIFEGKYYKTKIKYLDNGNKIPYTEPNWKQRDFKTSICETPEEKLEKQLDKIVYRR